MQVEFRLGLPWKAGRASGPLALALAARLRHQVTGAVTVSWAESRRGRLAARAWRPGPAGRSRAGTRLTGRMARLMPQTVRPVRLPQPQNY